MLDALFPVQMVDGTGSIPNGVTLEQLCSHDTNFLAARVRLANQAVVKGAQLLALVRDPAALVRQRASAVHAAPPLAV